MNDMGLSKEDIKACEQIGRASAGWNGGKGLIVSENFYELLKRNGVNILGYSKATSTQTGDVG